MTDPRENYLQDILSSSHPRKIIISGPGTGKTYTFKKIFEHLGEGRFLALTFIRKLAQGLQQDLPSTVSADTFHAFCKGVLHRVHGTVDIFPQLTEVIKTDALVLNPSLCSFDEYSGL